MAKEIMFGKTKGRTSAESLVDVLFPITSRAWGAEVVRVARLLCLRHQGTKRQVLIQLYCTLGEAKSA